MQNYSRIERKIDLYIRKFYISQLIKGALLFVGFSLLLAIIAATLEYFLWFESGFRTLLFWSFLLVDLVLLAKWIFLPLTQLFKLSKGIDYDEASAQIGTHFPEVSDKLRNILQLKRQGAEDELILASIEQKSHDLKSIPFQMAIDFKHNLKYLRFLIIPVLVLLAIWISGFGDSFSYSYERVLNYNQSYEAPAPFRFSILNENLNAQKGKPFLLNLQTIGEVKPEDVFLEVDGKKIQLNEENGIYSYKFQTLQETTAFRLKAGQVNSKIYEIKALNIPVVKDMLMKLSYPAYTNQKNTSISGTGNVSVPEGTLIEWMISTESTSQVDFYSETDTLKFDVEGAEFTLKQIQKKNKVYSIATSNTNFEDYERLTYSIEVTKDEYPKLKLKREQDSLLKEQSYFFGKLTDDYGLTKLQLVYYSVDNEDNKTRLSLPIAKGNYAEFSYAFPNDELELKAGSSYNYYFEVYDNDQVNGSKAARSKVFTYRQKTALEASKDNLKRQNASLEKLSKELDKRQQNKKQIKELQDKQKKEQELNYTEKQKLESFIQRQKQQLEMMKNYSERLKEDFKKMDAKSKAVAKENLEERLEKNKQQIEDNQKLLDELEKLQDQINQEELNQKLEEYEKESGKQEKNLKQLLELTKRFYVEQKAEKLAEELKQLAEDQQELSESDENNAEEQQEMNQKFDELKQELEELEEKNKELKAPMELGSDQEMNDDIDKTQEEAKEKLEAAEKAESDAEQKKSSKTSAKQKQKRAAEKMKALAQQMQNSMSSSSREQAVEDAEMLRQILSNLITFSQEQEGLMYAFKEMTNSNPAYASKLKRQAELRENFKHVDDSLYALAMRTPMITETVNNKISDIDYNIDKSLERLAENEVRKGTSSQQYTMMYANELSNMLDNALDQMQNQMNNSGQPKPGRGEAGEQLSDIIKSHDELKEQMQKGQSKGKDKDGQQKQPGEKGKDGEKSKNAKQKQPGEEGEESGKKESPSGNEAGENTQEGRPQQEQMSGEIYKIYKKQQQLRDQLEDRIEKLGLRDDAGALEKSLDKLEQELLMKGFSSDLLKQMEEVNHQLLKLDKAANQQGIDEDREAETRKSIPASSPTDWREKAKEYFNTTEILNRQQLPLQPEYKKLINIYFDEKSD